MPNNLISEKEEIDKKYSVYSFIAITFITPFVYFYCFFRVETAFDNLTIINYQTSLFGMIALFTCTFFVKKKTILSNIIYFIGHSLLFISFLINPSFEILITSANLELLLIILMSSLFSCFFLSNSNFNNVETLKLLIGTFLPVISFIYIVRSSVFTLTESLQFASLNYDYRIFLFFCLLVIAANLCLIILKSAEIQAIMNSSLENLKKMHTNLDKAETLISSASHEIRNPLNIILFHINDLLDIQKKAIPFSEIYQKDIFSHLSIIKTYSLIIKKLADNILLYNSLKNNQTNIIYNTIFNKEIIDEMLYTFEPIAKEKKISFIYEEQNKIPVYLSYDLDKSKQIFSNIILNAFKFTPEGGSIKFSNFYNYDKQTMISTITDDGIGINLDKDNHLKPYSGLEKSFRKNYTGFGLGLTIANELIALLNGSIKFINNAAHGGKGTTVIIEFPAPISKQPPKRSDLDNDDIFIPENYFNGSKVLCVDDNELNLMILKLSLEKIGITPQTANSVEEARTLIEKNIFDLCITDITMPNFSGIDFLNIIKLEQPQTIVFSYTGNVMPSEIQYFKNLGFSEVLEKPLDQKQLKKYLIKYLSKC